MTKVFVFTVALAVAAAACATPGEPAFSKAKKAHAQTKAACERQATLQLRVGKERARWIRRCVAKGGPFHGKAAAHRPLVHPSGRTAIPRAVPLGSGRPSSMGSTAPSNAPVAPSAPVIGSSGNSTSGSRATSTTGSSNSSIGGGSLGGGSSSGGGM
jgi:uncharacterized membrane protein YgcG